MNDITKIGASHLGRAAYIYLRQSTPSQVEHNRESTQRQYALAARATTLGWPSQQVIVVDEDLGLSGSGIVERNGFARLTAEVALGHVGIVLGLEVSRLARNNADWYRLLDLCGLTDTLIGDADGIYHPAMFNDRLLLGLKGTMSEAELHIIRARLNGGIRNKAARGELRRGLPVGFIWGEQDGEVRFHPDEAVCSTIRTVFARFAELGSARRVWLWFRSEGLSFPLQTCYDGGAIRWVDPSYIAIYHVLSNPAYAGAYAYGKSRREVSLDVTGARKKRVRKLPRSQWSVFIPNHHEGFIDMATYEANRTRITANTHPRPHQPSGGAVREGSALLQGVAVCGHCGRKLRTHYTGRTASAGYHCAGKTITNGRGVYCLSIGAVQVDQAVAQAVLAALAPLGIEASLAAAERLEADRDGALAQWRLAVERTSYEAQRTERRYRAVDPDNRLVARGLEAEWEKALRELETAKAELARREQQRPRTLSVDERSRLLALGTDLFKVWQAPTTAPRDKKELLRTLLEEVIIALDKEQRRAHLTLRWHGSSITEIDLNLQRRPAAVRTDEDTVALVRRLAIHYPDAVIAGILNRQERRTAYGHRFTTHLVSSLRRNWDIQRFEPPAVAPQGELMNIKQIAAALGVATSTVHRWLNEGIIAGEQLTPGAPWRIRLTDDLRARVAEEAPDDFLTMYQTMRLLGVSRQTVWQRVKRGEIKALHVRRGRKKGLRLKVIRSQSDLFDQTAQAGV